MLNEEITDSKKNEANSQILQKQKEINYDTKDYTIELLVNKFKKKDFYIPIYQREFIWRETNKMLFLESIFLGLPIPFMFFGECADGRLEVIDGAQRLQTIVQFVRDNLKIKNMEKLDKINGFTFKDLPISQQRKFLNKTLRIIILGESTPDFSRQDLFHRINTTGIKANDSEVRRGAHQGKLTDFINRCSEDELFIKMCPISVQNKKRHEGFELILRFFAYLNNYQNFIHRVDKFLDQFLIDNKDSFKEELFLFEFEAMLIFVEKTFPYGFAKTKNAKSTPRVRFEALAVGVALALRENPSLTVKNITWLEEEEFKLLTTSDASNNNKKLQKRIEYVRDVLLKNGLNDGYK